MKKRLLLFALAVLCLFTANAQTPDWKWLKVGTGTIVSGNTIATDADGNSYITGNFQSYILFGTKTLTSLKANSIYIAKYDNTGKMLWIKQADNTAYGNINAAAIAIDASGNCYITGSFTYTVLFDTTHLTTTGSPAGIADAFVVKYDKDGNFVWLQHPQHSGGTSYDITASGITIDANNMVTIAGTGSVKIDFGNSVVVSGGFHGTFITQYNSSGVAQWAKYYYDKDNVGYVTPTSIASDKDGNLLVSGFGNGQKTDLGASSVFNMPGGYYIAKYDKNGGYIWAKTVYGPQASAISVDGSGNPAITGYFKTSGTFDGSTTITAFGGYDLFVAKYDKDGNLKWVNKIGTSGDEKSASSVVQDANGNVYISGSTPATSAFDSKSIPTDTKIPGYGYVAKYNNSGAIQWLQNVTLKSGAFVSNSTFVYDIALDGSGNIYATGNTAPSTMFGSFESSQYGTYITQIGSGSAPAPPAAPTNLTATPHKKVNDGKITLSWMDNSNNETGFIINRSIDNTNWTAIDSVAANTTTYNDSNLANLTKFYYKVVAYNGSGVSSASNVVDATTLESGIADKNPDLSALFTFPNPSNGNFILNFHATGSPVKIRIQNMLGQVVYEKMLTEPGNQCQIEIPESVKGLLLIAFSTNGNTYSLKHLVQ